MRRRMIGHVCPDNIGSDDFGRQAVETDIGRPAVKAEPVKEKPVKENPEEEGIEFEDMTILELRDLARAEGITGIYSKSKAELIDALKG